MYLRIINNNISYPYSLKNLREDLIFFEGNDQDIKKILAPNGVWVLEQSYMPFMLKTNSFDTICHEHLEYYCLKQINYLVLKNNLKIIDVFFNDINGGSFQVHVAHANSKIKEVAS